MSLRAKLVGFCLVLGLLPTIVVGVVSVRLASQSLSDAALHQLASVRDAKLHEIEALFGTWEREALLFAGVKEVYNALGMLRDHAWGAARPGERMDVADEEYVGLLDYVAGAFRPFVDTLGFDDAYLIGDDGRVYFTLHRGGDLGEDLKEGAALGASNLRRAWEGAMAGDTVFVDMKPYAPLGGKPAAFVASPVRDHNGEVQGVAALRLPLDQINAILSPRSGMGRTGETYVVGGDGLMRSDSVLSPATHSVAASFADSGRGRVDTEAVRLARQGKSEVVVMPGYRGDEVLSAFAPVASGALGWALMAEVETGEAFAPVRTLRMAALGLGAAVILLAALAMFGFARYEIVRPLNRVRAFLQAVGRGDFKTKLQGPFRAEMGHLADGVNAMYAETKKKLGFAQGVLEGITQPCMVLHHSGTINFANSRLLELMGKPGDPEDYYGQTPGEFFFGEPGRSTVSTKALGDRRTAQGEVELEAADGTHRTVSVDASPVYDLDGRLLGVFTQLFDLTHIREQERRITDQARRMGHTAQEAGTISETVSAAAGALLEQVRNATRGATAQSERAEMTAASMQQMNEATLEVARNASDAARNASDAREKALAGDDVVRRMVDAIQTVEERTRGLNGDMQRLGSQVENIGGVIGVISDIADQTNLLALNAAIEAARAGESGRGFAVVADEVRKLAEKTMDATRQVTDAIGGIRAEAGLSQRAGEAAFEAVAESTRLAEVSGAALREIVEIIDGTAARVQAIAAASEQQSATSDQISAAVDEISGISRGTLDDMSRSSEAIDGLRIQAQRLDTLIRDIN